MLRGVLTALECARQADAALAFGDTKDAAWLALLALELDESTGLAFSVSSRILLELNDEPLGTIAGRRGLELGVPDALRPAAERHHRVDLWRRGLLLHRERRAILTLAQVDDAEAFEPTARLEAWFQREAAAFGEFPDAARAAMRLIGALSDAFEVPDVGEQNPLASTEGWTARPEFLAFKVRVAREGYRSSKTTVATPEPAAEDQLVMSDYWLEHEIASLASSGHFDEALTHAEMWSRVRPKRMAPLAMKLRIEHAGGLTAARDETARAMLHIPTEDLNELEEARVALGELRLWAPQIAILDRMDALAGEHPVILTNRGVAYIELGEHERGVKDLESALRVDPNSGPALANLGLEKMRVGDYVSARRLLERALEAAPEQAQVHVYLAACRNNQGDRTGAMGALERALELEPTHAQARQLLDELRGLTPKGVTNGQNH